MLNIPFVCTIIFLNDKTVNSRAVFPSQSASKSLHNAQAYNGIYPLHSNYSLTSCILENITCYTCYFSSPLS